jgi:predicted phosphohydrolase
MELFGPEWEDHPKKIASAWDTIVSNDDLVLIPGDISWALRLKDALPDLEWIEKRPGIKVIIKGNHDYWWSSLSKVKEVLPPSIHLIQNSSVTIGEVSIAGTRLWTSPEYSFDHIIDFKPCITEKKRPEKDDAAIFQREITRLEMSLKSLPKEAKIRIAMTHFPPIGIDLAPSAASALFEKYGVSLVVFGHLHSLHKELLSLFGSARGVHYELTACDFVQFSPKCLSLPILR